MLLTALLNGLAFGGYVYILSSGLGIAFGLMRVVNLSHGALYLLGGYIGLSILRSTASWSLGLVGGAVSMAVVAIFLERSLLNLKQVRGNAFMETLITLGVAYIIAEIGLIFWGGRPLRVVGPAVLSRPIRVFGVPFSFYRLVVFFIAVALILALWLVLKKTKIGMMIRAGIDDIEITKNLGINTTFLFGAVFALAGFLAGAAGIIGGTMSMLAPGEDWRALMFSVVAVLLGGLGTFWGTVLASFVVGLLYSFGTFFFPQFSLFVLFVPVALIIMVRPYGLFGREK